MSGPREVGRLQGEPWPGDDPLAVAAAPPPTRAVTTIREWPPELEQQVLPVRVEALAEARAHEGEHEGDKNNHGAIVRYSIEGLPGQHEGGAWCACFVCQVFRRVLLRRGDQELLRRWLALASGNCDRLWANLSALGWGWNAGGWRLPERGDIVFCGTPADLDHVGMVSHADLRFEDGRAQGKLGVISGNSGRKADAVLEKIYDLAKAPSLRCFVRVPW